ncbi:hypothetical protein AUEXF2481DRAFT_27484 [Aureobasidium subglaciale EXF-2481]|uniref:Uncharacterized protein n=1 Tax=Aureobasidium subglaciale (strain EXF-2481) TaxID=1043005 RepID=A0A074ZF15_AURSE|nr:uncharacterized protein AUEXF2481DRAFT_27484 [Aureobasidium subglaciale EXF-2481]KEQ97216.1 hypothetical protein AUEXF2481DRAFT_27484 [Aureobasidium subglaciale EXF-2481]
MTRCQYRIFDINRIKLIANVDDVIATIRYGRNRNGSTTKTTVAWNMQSKQKLRILDEWYCSDDSAHEQPDYHIRSRTTTFENIIACELTQDVAKGCSDDRNIETQGTDCRKSFPPHLDDNATADAEHWAYVVVTSNVVLCLSLTLTSLIKLCHYDVDEHYMLALNLGHHMQLMRAQ